MNVFKNLIKYFENLLAFKMRQMISPFEQKIGHKAFEVYNDKVIKTDNEHHAKKNFIDFMLDKYMTQDGLVIENRKI